VIAPIGGVVADHDEIGVGVIAEGIEAAIHLCIEPAYTSGHTG